MNERNERNRRVIEEFRANKGKVAQFGNIPLLLLHHNGAKTRRSYVNPLAYLPDGDRMVVFATMGGAPTNPDWYHNLVAHPDVSVELGDGEVFAAKASVAHGSERERLYDAQVARVPVFGDYRTRTSRVIPVIVLERI